MSVVGERLVAVRAERRNVKRSSGFCGKKDAEMLEKGRRIGPHIDDDIKNTSANAPHELRFLRRWDLEVHSAQSAFFFRSTKVRLDNFWMKTLVLELPCAKNTGE